MNWIENMILFLCFLLYVCVCLCICWMLLHSYSKMTDADVRSLIFGESGLGKTKSGTDKGNMYQIASANQRSSKHIKVWLINRWARIYQDEPKSGAILHDSLWFSQIQILSPGLLEPGVHQFVARRFHLLLAGHTGDLHAVVVLSCGHGAGWDEE